MRTRLFAALPALLLFTLAHAAGLEPYQQAALEKMLSQMPASQREIARPQLEMTVRNMSKAHVEMMMAGMEGKLKQQPAPAPRAAKNTDKAAGEWGAAEADFDKAFAIAQSYIGHVSDQRDASAARWTAVRKSLQEELERARKDGFVEEVAVDTCNSELNLVPQGRRQHAAMADTFAEQDRLALRLMIEHRATHGTLEKFAKTLNQPVSSELVQAVKYYFAAPMAEADVRAVFLKLETDLAALLESSTRERTRITSASYPDSGPGVVSKIMNRELTALRDRTVKSATAICQPGLEAYQRGLVAIIAPVVPKVQAYVK